jgi:hypothetical protein
VAKHDTFNCIGLLTVFPSAFLAAGLISGAVGLQRFTTPPGDSTSRIAVNLGTGWQPVQVSQPNRTPGPPSVIHLPGPRFGAANQEAIDAIDGENGAT